jgi:glycerol kinase
MSNILIFDVGTSSMRGILYDEAGRAVYKAQQKYSPLFMKNHWVEQNPATWRNALVAIAREITAKAREEQLSLAALALTSQRSSVIAMDRYGEPLGNAIMWQDKRTCGICQKLKANMNEIYLLTGLKIDPVFAAPKMAWIRRNAPEIFRRTAKFITIHDYLLFLLTGRYRTDHSIGSRSLLMNLNSCQWDDRLLQLFGVDRSQLCDPVAPGSICGYVTPATAEQSGLPSGLPVITAGGDQQCAALGLNVIQAGSMMVNTGTGSYLLASSNQPRFDKNLRVLCNIAALPGQYIIEANVLTTGVIYRWFNENFYPKTVNNPNPFALMNQEAQAAPVGSNGVLMLPYFHGSGAPHFNPVAKGVFFNVTLGTKRGDFARAVLEGIAAEVAESIQVMEEITGPVRSVNVAGGLTKVELFNQIQADMYNKDISRYPDEEASALGAWISAAKTLQIFPSYEAAFQKATAAMDSRLFHPNPTTAAQYVNLKKQKTALDAALTTTNAYSLGD